MKTNVKRPIHRVAPLGATLAPAAKTHEGAVASRITVEQQLQRLVCSSMLWEDNFYVDGKTVAENVAALIPQCRPEFVASLAVEARTTMKLRHMPLFIAREMARGPVAHRVLVAALLEQVVQRADELTEFLAIYWKDKADQPLSAQVKKGLARAFTKFSEYNLAKYNRDGAVKLRDVAFLTHVKPKDDKQASLMARLVNKSTIPRFTKGGHEVVMDFGAEDKLPNPGLETPDTWEVELSAGKGEDKRASWERLLSEGKLGAMAFLRNLRNMTQAGVDKKLIAEHLAKVNTERVLPFRFISAARAQPGMEDILEPLMLRAAGERPKLAGKTCLLIDVSGSMNQRVSTKSEITRLDAACGVGMLLREICDDVVIGRFNTTTALVPPRRGFAMRDAVGTAGGGTSLGQAVTWANAQKYDRIIVLTDEQSYDRPAAPLVANRGYIINVAAHKNGVGYGPWVNIDGWSEGVIDYIHALEAL